MEKQLWMKIDNYAQNSSLSHETVKVNHDDAWLAIKRLRGYTLNSNTHSYGSTKYFPRATIFRRISISEP
jgi:hypothetical protein